MPVASRIDVAHTVGINGLALKSVVQSTPCNDTDAIEHLRDESLSVSCSAESCESAGDTHICAHCNDVFALGWRIDKPFNRTRISESKTIVMLSPFMMRFNDKPS